MSSINTFDANVYSEELYSFTEEEYAEVMSASTQDDFERAEQADFEGYEDWGAEIERPEGDLENFELRSGQLHYKGEHLARRPHISGIEV